jgi:hypothetical protein
MAHEGAPFEIEEVSFAVVAANGIWSIENHHQNVMAPSSLHAQSQSGTEGIYPGAYILEINYQDVDV